jgi:hypothetical protein
MSYQQNGLYSPIAGFYNFNLYPFIIPQDVKNNQVDNWGKPKKPQAHVPWHSHDGDGIQHPNKGCGMCFNKYGDSNYHAKNGW